MGWKNPAKPTFKNWREGVQRRAAGDFHQTTGIFAFTSAAAVFAAAVLMLLKKRYGAE